MTTAHLNQLDVDSDLVVRWRLEELVRAGYSRRAARLIACRTDVDLHSAVNLVRRGCPVDTALKILF